MLALHRAPESFDNDVSHQPSFAVHTDLDAVWLQDTGELLTSESAIIAGLQDLGPAVVCNGLFRDIGATVCGHASP
jgi:hypothetical protein